MRQISTFEDARGVALRSAEPEQLERFTALFWETVESMDESERLKLVGMATGSLVRFSLLWSQHACFGWLMLTAYHCMCLCVCVRARVCVRACVCVQVAPPKLIIKLIECTNSAQAAYAQVNQLSYLLRASIFHLSGQSRTLVQVTDAMRLVGPLQACIHELHVPDYRDEAGACVSAGELKDVLLRTAAMASVLGIDTL